MVPFRVCLMLWLAWGFGSISGWAVELSRGPLVLPTPTNATVGWSTDVAAGGRVHYGTSVKQMETRVSAQEVAVDHKVLIPGLKPGTTYWYTVGTARIVLSTNSFITPGTSEARVERAASERSGGSAVKATPSVRGDGIAGGSVFDATKLRVPPARQTWGAPRSLPDHFDRHGGDFAAKNPDDYAAQAWIFLRRARAEGLPAKLDEDGVLRVYDPKTRAFAAYNRDLTTRTYFKPGRKDYFDDQPGKPVDLLKLVQ